MTLTSFFEFDLMLLYLICYKKSTKTETKKPMRVYTCRPVHATFIFRTGQKRPDWRGNPSIWPIVTGNGTRDEGGNDQGWPI
jgi:hypothetical protein